MEGAEREKRGKEKEKKILFFSRHFFRITAAAADVGSQREREMEEWHWLYDQTGIYRVLAVYVRITTQYTRTIVLCYTTSNWLMLIL